MANFEKNKKYWWDESDEYEYDWPRHTPIFKIPEDPPKEESCA